MYRYSLKAAAVVLALVVSLVSTIVALADTPYSYTIAATHYLHGDGQGAFDYIGSAPSVPMTSTVVFGGDALWLASPVGAGDFNGTFIEAGWITFPSTSPMATTFKDCVYPWACAWTNTGYDGAFAVHSNGDSHNFGRRVGARPPSQA